VTAEALDLLVPLVRPGVTTDELDRAIDEFARDRKAVPASLNYRGFPYSSNRLVASRSRSYRLVSGNGGNQDSRRTIQLS